MSYEYHVENNERDDKYGGIGKNQANLLFRRHSRVEVEINIDGKNEEVVADEITNTPETFMREIEGRLGLDASCNQKPVDDLIDVDNGENRQQPTAVIPDWHVKMPCG